MACYRTGREQSDRLTIGARMRFQKEATLDLFRTPGNCEWCGKLCRRREPHHLWAKGMGGGSRLDLRINLVALGSSRDFGCDCHTQTHAGRITRADLLAVVARRERCLQDEIEAVVWLLQRTPNGTKPEPLEGGAGVLLERVMAEIERGCDERSRKAGGRRTGRGKPPNGSRRSHAVAYHSDAGQDARGVQEGDDALPDRTLRVTLPLPLRELSPNSRCHWARKAAAKKKYRSWAAAAAWAAKGSWAVRESVRLKIVLYARDRRSKWDRDNLIAAMKAAIDGLADAGIVYDDRGVSLDDPEIVFGDKDARMELVVTCSSTKSTPTA